MRDQVTEFFYAHKVEAAERTYKQSIERINNCVDLKAQQESQLASWLGQHGNAGGNRSNMPGTFLGPFVFLVNGSLAEAIPDSRRS